LELNEDLFPAMNSYAVSLLIRNLMIEKASRYAKRCIDHDENNPVYNYAYALSLHKSMNDKEAIVFSQKAIDSSLNDFKFYELHGDIHFCLNEKDKALSFWKKSLEIGNQSEKLQYKIKNLDTLERKDL
jgi:tetratricopeptide (TPR) repeat protein